MIEKCVDIDRTGTKFNQGTRSTVFRGKSSTVKLATQSDPGLMSKEDFCKLESIVIPPPTITLSSNNCDTRIKGGIITMSSGDQYVKVDSYVNIKQNEDGTTPSVYERVPLKIYENTYGVRFSLDIDKLSFTLIRDNRLRIRGLIGEKGETGVQGNTGAHYILSGPKGRKGATGTTPAIVQTLQSERVGTVTVGSTAITGIRPVINNDGTYDMVVTRQPIGNPGVTTSNVDFGTSKSTWAVVVRGPGGGQTPHYLDIAPIISTISGRAMDYANIIKKGYEDAIEFWIQTMSDLFDAQKSALCCALERCESRKKNLSLQQHWEMTAAMAKPEYKAVMRPRSEATQTGAGAGVLRELYDDACGDGVGGIGGVNNDCVDNPQGANCPPAPIKPPTPDNPVIPPAPIDPDKGNNINPSLIPRDAEIILDNSCGGVGYSSYAKPKTSKNLDIIILLPYGQGIGPMIQVLANKHIEAFLDHLEDMSEFNTWDRPPRVGYMIYYDNVIEVMPLTPITDRQKILQSMTITSIPNITNNPLKPSASINLAAAIEAATVVFQNAEGSTGARVISLFGNFANTSGTARVGEAAVFAKKAGVNIIAHAETPNDWDVSWFSSPAESHFNILAGNTSGILIPKGNNYNHFYYIASSLVRMMPSRPRDGGIVGVAPFTVYGTQPAVTCSQDIFFVIDNQSSMACAILDMRNNDAYIKETFRNNYPKAVWSIPFFADRQQTSRINSKTDDLLNKIVLSQRSLNEIDRKPTIAFFITDRPFTLSQERLENVAASLIRDNIKFVGIHVDSRYDRDDRKNTETFDIGAGAWKDTAQQLNYLAQATGGAYSRSTNIVVGPFGSISYGTPNDVTTAIMRALTGLCKPNNPMAPIPPPPTTAVTTPPPTGNIIFSVLDTKHIEIDVDAVLNSGYATSGVALALPRGHYLAQILYSDVQIGGKYSSPLRVAYRRGMSTKSMDFVDKGEYNTQSQSQNAVEGSALTIAHDGGLMKFFVPNSGTQNDNKGKITVSVSPQILFLDRATIDGLNNEQTLLIAGVSFPLSLKGDPGSDVVRFEFDGNQLVPTKHNP